MMTSPSNMVCCDCGSPVVIKSLEPTNNLPGVLGSRLLCGVAAECVPHTADSLDLADQLVSWPEESWRFPCQPHTGRSAGEQHITGEQRKPRGQLRHQPRHREREIYGPRVLHRLTVEGAADSEIVRVAERVGRDEERSD